MPKVSDAHRESRREQILSAALTCFAENGFQRTSMADIIQASVLSAGAIYLHFASKQQIALAVGRQVLGRRLGELADLSDVEHGALADPVDTLRAVLSAMVEEISDSRLLVQLWGEATTDSEMSSLVADIFGALREAWVRYLAAWARSRGAADPEAWADGALPAVLALAQGFFVQRALIPGFDADVYFASLRLVADPGLLSPARADR